MRVVESMMLLVLFYFLGELIADAAALPGLGQIWRPLSSLRHHRMAFARYFDLTLRMFSESIRLAQVTGCLEAMLSSQTGCCDHRADVLASTA